MSRRSQKVSVAAGCNLVRSRGSNSGSSPLKRACSNASSSTALRPGSAVPRPTRNDIPAAIEAQASRRAVLPNPARPSTTTTVRCPLPPPRDGCAPGPALGPCPVKAATPCSSQTHHLRHRTYGPPLPRPHAEVQLRAGAGSCGRRSNALTTLDGPLRQCPHLCWRDRRGPSHPRVTQ